MTEEEKLMESFKVSDMRVSEILSVERHPDSDVLYVLKIDVNEEEPRTILSGLQKHVAIEDVKGRCVVYSNLKPRKLAGTPSNGMVLCTTNPDGKIEIIRPNQGNY